MNRQAYIYSRVSTDEQAKGYSLTTQVDACQRYAGERGYAVKGLFQDDYTGASLDRPGLNRLRDALSAAPVDIIIVYDIDRLARKSIYQMLLEEEFGKHGAVVEYVIGQYANTDEGRLQKQIRASIAEYEKAKIMERSKRGKRGKAKSGFPLVAARPPYGYTVIPEPHKSRLEIDEEEARIVRLIYQWYIFGDDHSGPLSMFKIAMRLTQMQVPTRGDKRSNVAKKFGYGIWQDSTVGRILNNQTYTGIWHFGKTQMINDGIVRTTRRKCGPGKQVAVDPAEWISVKVPAIIEPELFLAAQQKIQFNIEQASRNAHYEYLLSKRLKCAQCGHTFTGRTTKNHSYYNCCGTAQMCQKVCNMPGIRCGLVDDAVWVWVRNIIESPQALAYGLDELKEQSRENNRTLYDRLEIIKSQLADSENQYSKLLDLYLNGEFSHEMLTERKVRLEDSIAKLKLEQADLAAYIQSITITDDQVTDIQEFCAVIRKELDDLSFANKRRIFEYLDMRAQLAIENNQWVVYVKCLISNQRLSIETTLPS